MSAKKPAEAFKKPKEAEKQEEKDKEEALSIQFKLTPEEKKDVVDKIEAMLQESESSRSGWLQIRRDSINQYEGIKQPSDFPWPNHSNVSTMVTTVACDLLHSKLFPMVWNEGAVTWEGREEHDIETSEINTVVMSWVASVDMKLQDKVDDIVHRLVVDGTVAIKELWVPYWTYVTRKIPKITFESIQSGKLEYEVRVDYIRRERCELDIRPLERVFIPYNTESSSPRWEDDAEYILDERWYTPEDLKEMKANGEIDQSVNLDELVQSMDELNELQGTAKDRAEAEGSSAPNTIRKEGHKLRCIEGYIKHAVVKGDVRRKQCVFLVVIQPKFYLSGKALHHVSRIGRRPWIIRPFMRRPGRAYGKGIPEMVRHLHTLLDAIHNQRIDAGNRVIGGGGFYRPASGTKARKLRVGPATWVPVDDPKNDVYIPSYNMSGLQWSAQEERLVMELIERLTYLTPAMLGRETASRPTARGTLAVIQQGEAKFGLIGRRVQSTICEVFTDVRQKYEENMPPAKWERIMGRKRIKDWPSPEYMAGMYEAKMQLDLTAVDPEGKRTLAGMVFQTMAMDPLVLQNPAFMWEVRANYLRALKQEPVERFIGPKPPTPNPKDADDIFTMLEQEQTPDLTKVDPATVLPRLVELRNSERYEQMPPEAKTKYNAFLRELQLNYIDKVQKGVELSAQFNTGGAQGAPDAQGLRGLAPNQPGGDTGAAQAVGQPAQGAAGQGVRQ